MTLKEILAKYESHRHDITWHGDDWSMMDKFVEELAQLATGTPATEAEEDPTDDLMSFMTRS